MGRAVLAFSRASLLGAAAMFLLAGCTGAGKVIDIYDLGAPDRFTEIRQSTRAQILVLEPSALRSLYAQEIVVKTSPTRIEYLARSQWPDRLPKVVQARLVEAFENTGKVRAVAKPGEGLVIDYQIVTDIRSFQADVWPGQQTARVELSVKLVSDRTGKVLRTRVFETTQQLDSTLPGSVVGGLNEAFEAAAREIVTLVLAGV